MTASDKRPGPAPMDAEDWARNKERLNAQLEALGSDPFALGKLRSDPGACAMLMSLAQHGDPALRQALATTYLAIAFPDEPAVRTFLFGRLFDARLGGRDAALNGFLANHGDDDRALEMLVAGIADLPPGALADFLEACFEWNPFLGVKSPPPRGVAQTAWSDWMLAARSSRVRFLSRPDLQARLFDVMSRDPDGPVERTLEAFLKDIGNQQSRPEWTDAAYLGRERLAGALSDKVAALHAAPRRLDDLLQEFDAIGRRRVPGWMRRSQMFDRDLEIRQQRIASRMARDPDGSALRKTFENMLFDRPSLFPKVRDEMDYWRFEPMGWRRVAWATLGRSHWTDEDAVDFARLIVDLGPWDQEARKSKEAIEALVRTWPEAAGVSAFLAGIECRTDVGAFVRDDIASLRREARNGKDIRLDR